jgi:hypothetical protein
LPTAVPDRAIRRVRLNDKNWTPASGDIEDRHDPVVIEAEDKPLHFLVLIA